MSKPKKPIHSGRIEKGVAGGKKSSGKKVGHKEFGEVTYHHSDVLK